MAAKSSRFLGLIAYLLLVVAPVALLASRRDDELVRYHARQSLGLAAAAVVVFIVWAVVGYVISLVPFYGFLIAVVLFAAVIGMYLVLAALWITGMVMSLRAQLKPLPIIGRYLDAVFDRFGRGGARA